jgi:hypothetical protein
MFYNNTKKSIFTQKYNGKNYERKFMIEIFKYMCQKSSIMDTKAKKLKYEIKIVLI